ncbi:MAG: Uma2 family endonuclease [Salinarimonas sp.]
MPHAFAEAERGRLTPAQFRAFQEARPDHERWELIEGEPVMMTPPSLAHNRIASNLERLLNDALETHDPSREAVQRPGLELTIDQAAFPEIERGYRPEPDVAVIDHEPVPGRRFVSRAHLLAEIVSTADEARPHAGVARWIDVKTRLYRAHPPCAVVLVLEQERIAARLWRRSDDGWDEAVLDGAATVLDLAGFGLRCGLGALYQGTHLRPRRS